MWNKAQAVALNVCSNNPRPKQHEPDMDINNLPTYAYVSTKFVPRMDPFTKLTEYVQVSTGPAQRGFNYDLEN